jgi:rubrerythrin
MEMEEALGKALEFEKKGQKLYTEAAENTDNPVVEKTFNYLAEQEMHHINEIEGFIDHHKPDVELKGDQMSGVQEFFKTTTSQFKEKLELSDDDIEAHEAALDLEKTAYEFYKEQKDKAEDEDTKGFFEFLIAQEKAHYALIEKTYDYIKNPEAWYAEEEGWIEEGGGM